MSNFKLNAAGDIAVENGRIVMTEGREAIQQHLTCRFKTFLGEWFLDTTRGVPYFRDILVKNPTFSLVQDILKTVIMDTPGITELTRFDFDYVSARTLELNFACDTVDGPIKFSQMIGI